MTLKEKNRIQSECGMASGVLCNYLEGAVSDYEEGTVDNIELIYSCINTLYLIGDYGSGENFEKRMSNAIKEN